MGLVSVIGMHLKLIKQPLSIFYGFSRNDFVKCEALPIAQSLYLPTRRAKCKLKAITFELRFFNRENDKPTCRKN